MLAIINTTHVLNIWCIVLGLRTKRSIDFLHFKVTRWYCYIKPYAQQPNKKLQIWNKRYALDPPMHADQSFLLFVSYYWTSLLEFCEKFTCFLYVAGIFGFTSKRVPDFRIYFQTLEISTTDKELEGTWSSFRAHPPFRPTLINGLENPWDKP